MKNRLLITGSSGFIGSNFIKNSNQFDITEIDLLTIKTDKISFINIDSVLHLAAMVHQMKGAPEEQYYKINRDLAYEVAKRAKWQGVKQFVLMSTAKVYGESSTNDGYWNEESDCNPTDPYGKSKLEAETLISSLADENFKVAIIRSPLVYGAGVKANMFNLVKLVDKLPVLPLGGISNQRSMVYIGNLVALINNIISQQASGIFIAGDRLPLSTTSLVEYIRMALNKKRLVFRMPNLFLSSARAIRPAFIERLYGSLVLDTSNTNRRLNFTPPFSSEEGISEMVEWYRKQ